MKRIGILGGMGPQSTSALYLKILDKYFQKYGDQNYPEIVIFSVQFQMIQNLQNKANKNEYINELLKGVKVLEDAAVDFIAIAANTPHMVLPELAAVSSVPILSIVDCVAKKAEELQLKTLLLTGTTHTMQSNYYQKVFDKKGIILHTPNEAHQKQLEDLLVNIDHGSVTEKMKETFRKIIASYPVDGVILGCTEFPLLVDSADYSQVLLDTLDIQAEAVMLFASMSLLE